MIESRKLFTYIKLSDTEYYNTRVDLSGPCYHFQSF